MRSVKSLRSTALRPKQGFFLVPGIFWFMARSPKQMAEFEPNLLMKLYGRSVHRDSNGAPTAALAGSRAHAARVRTAHGQLP